MKARIAVATLLLWLLAGSASAVEIEWVTVGDPGNACDVQSTGCFGAVAEVYRIARTEVTNAQYAEFLNALAASDPNGLYNTQMGTSIVGGITRDGDPGSFTYSAVEGSEQWPVNFVSFYDSLRFVNWLNNGQPTGSQGPATSEDGAYTITAQGIANNTITRNAGATIFLPSENEWYKAAYYDPASGSYFDFPTGTDTESTCAAPGETPNTWNCSQGVNLFAVGSYPGSPSPNGTLDQGGSVWERNDTIVDVSSRGWRGGGFNFGPSFHSASLSPYRSNLTLNELNSTGLRVASVPEPGALSTAATAALCLTLLHERSRRIV